MLQPGDTIPDAVVQAAPGEEVRLRELVRDGTVLLLFFLFDWSST
jgi:peroxiredoxin